MRILMVVTDLDFPNYSGGGRRTLETSRTLRKYGHEVVIFSDRNPTQTNYSIFEGSKVFRRKLLEPGILIRKLLARGIGPFLKRLGKKFLGGSSDQDVRKGDVNASAPLSQSHASFFFDSHLDFKAKLTLADKVKNIYRHMLPVLKWVKTWPALPKLLKIIKKERIDILYERGGSYGVGVIAAKLTGRVCIVDFINVMYWDWALKHCDRIMSYFVTTQVPAFIPRSKIDLVYNTVDIARFNPDVDTSTVRKKYNLSKDMRVGVYTGGFYPFHGLHELIQAVNLLARDPAKSLVIKKARFLLIGKGETFEEIQRLVRRLSLEDYVIMPGTVPSDDVPQYVNVADFCFNTNWGDVLGMKLFEYMACEKPVIALDFSILSKFFKNNQTILLCKPWDPQDLANKINFLLDNPRVGEIIAKNARSIVLARHTWDQHIRNILNTIKKAVRARIH